VCLVVVSMPKFDSTVSALRFCLKRVRSGIVAVRTIARAAIGFAEATVAAAEAAADEEEELPSGELQTSPPLLLSTLRAADSGIGRRPVRIQSLPAKRCC